MQHPVGPPPPGSPSILGRQSHPDAPTTLSPSPETVPRLGRPLARLYGVATHPAPCPGHTHGVGLLVGPGIPIRPRTPVPESLEAEVPPGQLQVAGPYVPLSQGGLL